MSRILLAWEPGTGFGHLGPFLGLALRLLERGHELHIAARERRQGRWRPADCRAPGAAVPEHLRRPAGTAAELRRNPDALRLPGAGNAVHARSAQALAARYREPSVGTIGKQAVARIEALVAGLNGGRA